MNKKNEEESSKKLKRPRGRPKTAKKVIKPAHNVEFDDESVLVEIPDKNTARQRKLKSEIEKLQAEYRKISGDDVDIYARDDDSKSKKSRDEFGDFEPGKGKNTHKGEKTAVSTTVRENNTSITTANNEKTQDRTVEHEPLSAIVGVYDETEPYKAGVFLLAEFPMSTSPYKLTPSQLYSSLEAYSGNTTPLYRHIQDSLEMTYEMFIFHYKNKFKEVAAFLAFCEGEKANAYYSHALSTHTSKLSELPNIAFKGDEVIEFDEDTGEPLGELSQSFVKFAKDKHDILLSAAKIQERGSINEKGGNMSINNNNIVTNIDTIPLDKLSEVDPMDWAKM